MIDFNLALENTKRNDKTVEQIDNTDDILDIYNIINGLPYDDLKRLTKTFVIRSKNKK